MSIQISGGRYKGLKLKSPAGTATRPTSARVREAVLSLLRPWLDNSLILDVFSGSGVMGLSALSMGARGAVFVEDGRAARQVLKFNMNELHNRHQSAMPDEPEPDCYLAGRPWPAAMDEVRSRGPFQIIWADPPWQETDLHLAALPASLPALLDRRGVFALESDSNGLQEARRIFGDKPGWETLQEKKYGRTHITLFEYVENEPE